MYHLSDYGRMFADRGRTDAYLAALRAAITPGAVVLDLGAGSGFFSLAACAFGASKVYALDVSEAIDVLPALAAANGFGDRIVVHRGDAFAYEIPEKVDVIVSDLRGNLPFCVRSIELIAHARDRYLKPGGALLPFRDRLFVAPIEAPVAWGARVGPYAAPPLGFDMRAAREGAASEYHNDRGHPFQASQLLAPAVEFGSVDYANVRPAPIRGDARFSFERDGLAHGFALWFDAEIAQGIGYSNAPGEDHVYGRVFFAWPEPVAVRAGEEVAVALFAQPVQDDYIWGWTTTFADKVRFRQMNSVPLPRL